MKKLLTAVTVLFMSAMSFAQTLPTPSSGVWALIDTSYNIGSVSAGETKAKIYYGNSTTSKITALQFRIAYDRNAFDGGTPIVSLLLNSSTHFSNQNIDTANSVITLTVSYTGSSTTYSIPDGEIFEITFKHSSNFQNYIDGIIADLEFSATSSFPRYASLQTAIDTTLGAHSYGGEFIKQSLTFKGKLVNVTGSATKNVIVALERKPKTGSTWSQVALDTTGTDGRFAFNEVALDTTFYDARMYIKGDTLSYGNIVSTADAQKINRFVLGLDQPAGFDYYSADINGSNNITISDVYGVFGRVAGRFTEWANSVPDVLFFSKSEYDTINGSNTNYTSSISGVTNLAFTITGSGKDSVTFYVLAPGDANGTGFKMARTVPIKITNPNNANNYIIDQTVEYDIIGLKTMEVNMPSIKVEEGNLVNIPIKVITENELGALQLAIKYDKDLLEFRSIIGSEQSSKWMTFFNPADGVVEWGGYETQSGENNLKNNDQAVTLQFYAIKPKNEWGKSPLYVTRKFAGDRFAKDMIITPTDGRVEVLRISPVDNPFVNTDKANIRLFPNPVSDVATVQFNVTEQGDVNVAFYDFMGIRRVQVVQQNMPAGAYQYRVDLSGLIHGMYYVVLETNKEAIAAKAIVAEQ
jgi:hypothetical protein